MILNLSGLIWLPVAVYGVVKLVQRAKTLRAASRSSTRGEGLTVPHSTGSAAPLHALRVGLVITAFSSITLLGIAGLLTAPLWVVEALLIITAVCMGAYLVVSFLAGWREGVSGK